MTLARRTRAQQGHSSQHSLHGRTALPPLIKLTNHRLIHDLVTIDAELDASASRFATRALTILGVGAPLVLAAWLWLRARPWSGRVVNAPATFGAAASITAVLGTVLLSITIVLSARVRFVEGAVGGLDRVYRLHHWLGGITFMLLAIHPSLLAWRYAQVSWRRAAYLWLPARSDIALTSGQVALWLMTAAMAITVFVRVRHQVLLWLQGVLGFALIPAAVHVFQIGGDVGSYRPLRTLLMLAVGTGALALVAHTVLGRWLTRHHHYRLVAVGDLGAGVEDLRLRPEGKPMRFVPGQFAFMRFRHEAIGGEAHPFSMASSPTEPELRFVVKQLGDYTARLLDVHLGAAAVIEGPYGRFSHRFVRGRDQIWVAGGIGIAPFLSMAASLPDSGYQVTLFYCYADEENAPFREELMALNATIRELTVHESCDRRDGLITASAIAAYGPLDGREFLLCGPPEMTHSLREQLRHAGVPSSRIRFEEYTFT